jgi:hypothetical protein
MPESFQKRTKWKKRALGVFLSLRNNEEVAVSWIDEHALIISS